MQRTVVLRVGVTIKQIENEHLQNVLVFRVWIIWGGTKIIGGDTAPECPPMTTGLSHTEMHEMGWSIFPFLRLFLRFDMNFCNTTTEVWLISRKIRATIGACRHKQL